jgi:PAS domain S-box-containing protein
MNEAEVIKHHRNEAILIGQTQILRDIIDDRDLNIILRKIIRLIEGLSPNMKASIHLLDKSGQHLGYGVAPSLPEGYMRLIQGEPIGPLAGSCGTSAYTGQIVIVEDISTDYRWVNYAKVAMPFNLRACWSMPIISRQGKVIGTFAMYYDHVRKPTEDELELLSFVVTLAGISIERKQSQLLIEKSESLFKNSFQHAGTGMALLNVDGKFNYVNKALCELLEYSPVELLRKTLQEVTHPENSKDQQILLDYLATNNLDNYQKEIRLLTTNKEVVWATINVSIIRDDPDNTYLIVHIQNINETKKYQEKIITQNEELVKINKELDSFVYKASHDLRAPLTSILGLVNLADKYSDTNPALVEYFNHIRKSVTKLDEFVKELIDHSRNIRLAVKIEAINFQELIEDVFQNLNYMEAASLIKRHIEITSNSVFHSDKTRLKVIFSNLIANAIRYHHLPNDPFIKITVDNNNKEAVIFVEDNGKGIEAHHLDKIFDMFYRATDDKSGSGLGLYIVKETIEKLKGSIEVTSKYGKGTFFKITIPNVNLP